MHERSVVTLRDRLILYLYEHRVWGVELSELISGIGEKNVVDELSRLLEEGIIEEVGGKYILTISGIKEAEKIVEKIKEIKVIVKEKEELKEVRVAEQVVGKFVGRKKELEILKKLVDLAIEGKGGMVFVTGEAGLGRTRLINEAKEYAVSRGMVPMLGRCLYSEGMDPYLPIIEMLKNYMLAEKKEEVPIGLIPIHMPQLISPIKKKEDDFQLERSRMFDSIVKMIVDTAEEKPVFLFLDDIHWADKGTLRLLHYIANATKNTGVLICCAYRPEELVDKGAQDIIMRMGREGLFVTVELKKLSKEETKEMVSSLIKVGEIPDELIEKIYRDTEGNPLFIEETIKTLVSEGIISYEAGGIVIKERETALPERIRDVLLRRINMLEPTVMKIIGFASVIGTEFSIEVLKNVCEVGEEELITGLDSLVGARLIEEVQDKFATYRFTHLKTREVVYDDMSITKRRLFHKKVGLAIEELYKGRVEEVVHLLAWHFSLSKLPAKAIQYLVMAGDKAFKVYAWEVAIDSYSKAIAFAEESGELSRDEKIGLCMKLGESYELSGLYKEAQNYYLKSLELSKTGKECSYIHRKIGEMLEKDGKYDEALMHYETCIRELRLEEAKGEFGKTYACIGRIYSRKKEYPSATYYYLKAIEILGKIDTAMWDAADVCNSLGLIYWEMGNYKSALKYHEDSLNFRLKVSDLGDYYGLSASYVNLGNMFMNRMEYNDGIRCYETALELKKKIGEMEDIASTHDIIALSYKKIGQYERAKENFLTALDIRKKENDLTKIAISYANLGSIFYSMNDYDSALNFYNQCIELSKEIGVDVMATSNVAEICELLCLKKKFLEAKEYCKSGIAQIETRGFRENEFQIRLILGIVHRELGEFEESRENFEKCMKLGCEERDLGKLKMEYGLLFLKLGDKKNANLNLRIALEIFEKHNMDKKKLEEILKEI